MIENDLKNSVSAFPGQGDYFANKIVLITGASSKLGRKMSARFISQSKNTVQ